MADKERGKPDKVYALPDTYKYKGIPIGEIRQTAGWNNFDISKGKVKTQIIEVPSEKKPITVECYMKENSPVKEKGCLLFFHGGGFVSGSVAAVRNICKGIVEAGDICVLNVDYSLSPEYFYPTAIEEGLAVAEYVKYHAEDMQIDRNRIGTAGDSAGGNIAGAVAVRDRRQGLNIIKYQALLYPAVVIDREKENELCPWSCRLYEIAEDDDKILKAMNYIKDFSPHIKTVYAGEADTANEDISLICNPRMGMLSDTLIVTAEYDYLRIQGEYYAERLAAKGVSHACMNDHIL